MTDDAKIKDLLFELLLEARQRKSIEDGLDRRNAALQATADSRLSEINALKKRVSPTNRAAFWRADSAEWRKKFAHVDAQMDRLGLKLAGIRVMLDAAHSKASNAERERDLWHSRFEQVSLELAKLQLPPQ